jgi:hypothetical protein
MPFNSFAASAGFSASSAALATFSAKVILPSLPSLASCFFLRLFFFTCFLSLLLPAPPFGKDSCCFFFGEAKAFMANFPFAKGFAFMFFWLLVPLIFFELLSQNTAGNKGWFSPHPLD